MKILDVLPREAILADLKAQDKKSIIEELVTPIARLKGADLDELVLVLPERGTTQIRHRQRYRNSAWQT